MLNEQPLLLNIDTNKVLNHSAAPSRCRTGVRIIVPRVRRHLQEEYGGVGGSVGSEVSAQI